MSALDAAKELDRLDDSFAAIQAYERALELGQGDKTTFVDLAVLYFTLLDPGVSAALKLDQHFLDTAWTRANNLLDTASDRFGNDSEIAFWKRYFVFIVLGADEFLDECGALADPGESLVPFFYLWAGTNGREFSDEARRLYVQVASGQTARERYIRSILGDGGRVNLSSSIIDGSPPRWPTRPRCPTILYSDQIYFSYSRKYERSRNTGTAGHVGRLYGGSNERVNGLNGVTMRLRLLQPYILRMEFRVFPSIFARNGINGITKSLSKYPQKTDYSTAQKLMFLSGLDLHQVLQERDFLWGIGCRQTRGAARRGRRDLTTLTQTRIVPHRWSRQSRRRGEFLCVHGA